MAYFLQEEPQDGTTIMNNAVRNGAIQEQQNLIDRARQAAIEQDPTLSFVNRQIASGLLGAKTAWQDAFNKGDAQGMVNAQKAADSLRQQAASIGWDANGYGADVTLEQAAQNLANNDTRAINDLFYGMKRPGNYYQTSYDQYRDSGMSMNDAARNAQRDADNYQNENIDKLIDAYHMYGTDPRGAINQNGLRLLGMMAQQGGISPSELVNFYAKMQASPKDNWNFENRLIEQENANNYALGRMDRSQQYNRENQERAFAQQEFMAKLNAKLGIDKMLAQVQIGQMSREMAFNFGVNKLMEAGVPEASARQLMAAQIAGIKTGAPSKSNGNSGSKSGEGGMKISDANTIINQYRKWAEEHPDADPSANPFKDGYDEAVAAMNGYSDAPLDPDNADSVYSWATRICEENYRRGYPLNEAQLVEVISRAGGYGPQVAEDLKQKGMLAGNGGYGRKE
jgi:hypothetical protein